MITFWQRTESERIFSQCGYTLVELSVTMALSLICSMFVAYAFINSKKSELFLETRSQILDLKSTVSLALATQNLNTGPKRSCAQMIQPNSGPNFGVNGNVPPTGPVPIKILNELISSPDSLVSDGQIQGSMKYFLTLENWKFIQILPAVNVIHPNKTNQFSADIVIRGDRSKGTSTAGANNVTYGANMVTERIPILMEFLTSNALNFCSI